MGQGHVAGAALVKHTEDVEAVHHRVSALDAQDAGDLAALGYAPHVRGTPRLLDLARVRGAERVKRVEVGGRALGCVFRGEPVRVHEGREELGFLVARPHPRKVHVALSGLGAQVLAVVHGPGKTVRVSVED